LNENYVTSKNEVFRLSYSSAFLKWALKYPGYDKSLYLLIRNAKNKKILGCTMTQPLNLQVYDQLLSVAKVNFNCVHLKLRDKKMS